ncbi:MAG: MmgE/PrpD family protein [Rhodospirillales bacterium]|jgi:2-methylcitrate dehydratase PrpD|nr:MmgE/PrpD family protein [Rhodospirillales bacterium]
MSQEPTRTLAEFAAALDCDAIPEDARQAAKLLILDALACALAGHRGEETGQVDGMAAALGSSQDATVIGGGRRSLAGATLLNGYLVTAVTMCDVHRATLTHVTPEIVPPALAIAERDGASGRDLLTAIAAGCEVTTRVGIGLDYPVFRAKGWHGPGVIGPFGAAAAVGVLRGFDASTMARAFGLAGSQSAGTFAAWGTPTVKFHQCRGALSGLMAGLLAEQGFSATEEFLTAPDGGLYNTYAEGGRPEDAVADLGQRWELQRIALRLWPAATPLQEVITALFDLVARHDVAFDEIEKVRISLSKTPFDMHGGFATYKAKFEALLSAHYVSAVYLRDRTVTLAQFEPASYDDPALRRFAAERVEVVHDPALAGGQAVAEVVTKDGRTLASRCDHPLGTPENPLSRGQVEDKFRTYAEPVLSSAKAEEVILTIDRLEELGSSRTLLDLLRVPASN